MNRKQINQFAKRREDKMEERLIEMGFELVEDTGRRTVKKGDRLMKHKDTGLVIMADSKSTQNKQGITLTRSMLEKIKSEAGDNSLQPLGVIIFSFKGDTEMYAAMNLKDLEGVMY